MFDLLSSDEEAEEVVEQEAVEVRLDHHTPANPGAPSGAADSDTEEDDEDAVVAALAHSQHAAHPDGSTTLSHRVPSNEETIEPLNDGDSQPVAQVQASAHTVQAAPARDSETEEEEEEATILSAAALSNTGQPAVAGGCDERQTTDDPMLMELLSHAFQVTCETVRQEPAHDKSQQCHPQPRRDCSPACALSLDSLIA